MPNPIPLDRHLPEVLACRLPGTGEPAYGHIEGEPARPRRRPSAVFGWLARLFGGRRD